MVTKIFAKISSHTCLQKSAHFAMQQLAYKNSTIVVSGISAYNHV